MIQSLFILVLFCVLPGCLLFDTSENNAANNTKKNNIDAEVCGNSILEGTESCDGLDFGGLSCADFEDDSFGELSCDANCTIVTSACEAIPETCNDGTIDEFEDCEGTDLNGSSCKDVVGEGSEGILSCNPNCTFNTSSCTSSCGNEKIEEGEDCEDRIEDNEGCEELVGPGVDRIHDLQRSMQI